MHDTEAIHPMKIALCSDTFLPIVDGVGRVVHAYAKEMAARGHEITVVTPIQPTGFRGGFPYEIIDYLAVSTPTAAQYKAGVSVLDPHYIERIRDERFDLIHAHSPATAGIEALRLANKCNVPVIGTFHSKYRDDIKRYTHSSALATAGSLYVAGFYDRCDEVWTVSENAAETLASYGYRGEIQIVHNGSDMKRPDPEWEARARAEFSLGSAPILLFTGQIDRKKNVFRIVEAAKLLRGAGREFQLVFAGQGKDMAELKAAALDAGLGDITLFTGHIYDPDLLNGLYMAASLFVFPSMYDTAGLVVNEAAMMGVPTLAISDTAPAERITNWHNGLLCRDDPGEIADVMNNYLFSISDGVRAAMREAAQREIPEPWCDIFDNVEARYAKLLGRPHRRIEEAAE